MGMEVSRQDGLHNVLMSQDFQDALTLAVTNAFGPMVEPHFLEAVRRFVTKGRRNDSRSYAVGSEPATGGAVGRVKVLEHDDSRVFALLQNASPATVTTDTASDASSANAAAANNVSIVPPAGQTAYVTGFEVTGDGATASSTIVVTLTGVPGGPLSYELEIPAGAGTVIPQPLIVEFPIPIPATGPDVTITLNVPSFGAGNTAAAAVIHGFTRAIAAGPVIYVGGRQVSAGGQVNDPNGGIALLPGSPTPYQLDANVGELWAVASAAGADLRVLDVSA